MEACEAGIQVLGSRKGGGS